MVPIYTVYNIQYFVSKHILNYIKVFRIKSLVVIMISLPIKNFKKVMADERAFDVKWSDLKTEYLTAVNEY